MAAEPPQSSNKHNTLLVVACLGCTLYKAIQSNQVQSSPVQSTDHRLPISDASRPLSYSSSQASKSATKYCIDLS